MKISTPKDVEKLDNRIKNELGIDVQKYRNEEVVENLVELLVFPKYVITWAIRPILIALGIFIIGFFVFDLVHVEYIIYGSIGFGLFLANGILIGLLFLSWKMKSDMWRIVDHSLEIMKSAVNDMHKVNNQMTKDNRQDVLGLLFKGILHIVTIPMMSKVISDKVPFVDGFVNRIVKRILILVSDKVKFDEEGLKQELRTKGSKPNAIQVYLNSIASVSKGLEKVMNFTFGVAQFPLKMGFGIFFLILVLFLYLID